MRILITGSGGFVGRNLVAWLENTDGGGHEIMMYDRDTDPALLDDYCARAEFVYHLAGVNRPERPEEFEAGNAGLTVRLLAALEECGNACPVMLASSTQAALDNPYGRSKRASEEALILHSHDYGADALIYRFSNIFGKWCRPNYNSVVATFCHNIARGIPIDVRDPEIELDLIYIDDVIRELLRALDGRPNRAGAFCAAPAVHRVSLGRIVELINEFSAGRARGDISDMGDGFTRKLYATYTSYLPNDELNRPVRVNADARGSFAELLHSHSAGQVSVNITAPGQLKGNHWHHTKCEKFVMIFGTGAIRLRQKGGGKIFEYLVGGDKIEIVDIPAGYVHNMENLGDGDMITIMWASEVYDPGAPDTYYEEV